MNYELKNLPTEMLINKIKISLTELGFNEKYAAFEYLSIIITHMIQHESDSIIEFKNALDLIEKKFNIQRAAICNAVKKITDTFKYKFNAGVLYNLNKNSIVNRVRVIKSFAIQNIFFNLAI